MAAILLSLKMLKLTKGTLYVIPRTNGSGLTHNNHRDITKIPYEKFHLGKDGLDMDLEQLTLSDQWPDPDVYVHAASGQNLSGSETRNINRAYPGRPDETIQKKWHMLLLN